MKQYKKVLLATATALFMSAPAFAETLRIGTEGAYPPFNLVDSSGEVVGFDIDIANALCEEMEVTCEFVTQERSKPVTVLVDTIEQGRPGAGVRRAAVGFRSLEDGGHHFLRPKIGLATIGTP